MSHRISTRTLAGSAMFAAIAVVLSRVLSVQVIGERYSLETLPILLAGLFFGPVAGALVGFGSDLIGCLLLNPQGYNPIFCLPPLLLGLWAGLFRRQAEKGLRWTTLLLTRCFLHTLSQIHYGNLITDVFYYAQVMRNEQIGQLHLVLQVHHQVQDLRLDGNVQCGYRLITDNELGIQRQGSRNADTLTAPAVQLMRIGINKTLCQSYRFHQLENSLINVILIGKNLTDLDGLSDNLTDGQTGIQRCIRILENDLQILAQGLHF